MLFMLFALLLLGCISPESRLSPYLFPIGVLNSLFVAVRVYVSMSVGISVDNATLNACAMCQWTYHLLPIRIN